MAVNRLKSVNDFDSLLTYLRDELDWPVDDYGFDDLTFQYTATELGLDEQSAAKVTEIRRLRPLDDEQPWGIFFLELEPKRLPVVALRRLLSKMTLKKRDTSNRSDSPAWHADDILFISQTGESDERHLTFAHFAVNPEKADLPVLKVLGWDASDTVLRVDRVAEVLKEKLVWPEDPSDSEQWRKKWRDAFTLRHREQVTTAKEMASRLAELARGIRGAIREVLAVEAESGPLTKIMEAFRESLVHDLDPEQFADTYAQTITYGLLSARITDPTKNTLDDLALHMQTNPFLKELMESFIRVGGRKKNEQGVGLDFDELGVSDVIEVLDNANMEAVVRDFGRNNQQEDPVIHFFEGFLQEYDRSIRKDRGVWYTPRPVVSFIVRSVDQKLRTEFGLSDGLADTATWGQMAADHDELKIPKGVNSEDTFVQILDPATGTGTFLVEVIDLIHKTMTAKWRAENQGNEKINELWNEYVPRHLLPRLHGYELMMAPYAIAHMKIGLKLFETGYRFESDERARVYLTNALEPAQDFSGKLDFAIEAIAHEAEAVNEIKNEQRFTVVIGNPPYSGISSNMAPWIDGLLKGALPDGSTTASYYHVDGQPLGERKLWLQDDYVKFMRWSQHCISDAGAGIQGLISNHGYIDNPTFRGMRWSLMEAFNKIHVLDLHGNSKRQEVPPDGGKDENVFDIQQGVGVAFFVRFPSKQPGISDTSVYHADLWGERIQKYQWLTNHDFGHANWKMVDAAEPLHLFAPLDQSESGDYSDWPAINEVLPINVTGIVTARDDFVVDFDRSPLERRIADLRDKSLSDEHIREKYFSGKGAKKYPAGDSRGWKLPKAREKLLLDDKWDERFDPILYRPFDIRQTYNVPWMIDWPRSDVMPHMLTGENIGLIFMRQVAQGDEYTHFGVSRVPVDNRAFYSNRGIMNFGPLYLYPGAGQTDAGMFNIWPEGRGGRRPNLDSSFVRAIEECTKLDFESDGQSNLTERFGPEDVLAYLYAIFHSPEYRRRFEPMLKLDFPRIPLPPTREVFADLILLGRELINIHLLNSEQSVGGMAVPNESDLQVEKVSHSDETVWLDKARTRGFERVPETVWNFRFGGYQVCEKWLKDRGPKKGNPGRRLSNEDIEHYQMIVFALSETIRIMPMVDEVIDSHGGWPDAFKTADT